MPTGGQLRDQARARIMDRERRTIEQFDEAVARKDATRRERAAKRSAKAAMLLAHSLEDSYLELVAARVGLRPKC